MTALTLALVTIASCPLLPRRARDNAMLGVAYLVLRRCQ